MSSTTRRTKPAIKPATDRDRMLIRQTIKDATKGKRVPKPGALAKKLDGLINPRPKLDMPRVDYTHENLNTFLLDIRSGAQFVFDLHPSLLSETVLGQIERCVRRRWPYLWRSDMRALMEGPLKFIKLVPLGSEARTDCMLKFFDALWTAHWSGWLDKLVPREVEEPTTSPFTDLLAGPTLADLALFPTHVDGLSASNSGGDHDDPPLGVEIGLASGDKTDEILDGD